MNTYLLALSAAIACALCNGTAAVLQKISADKEIVVSTLDARLLIKLLKHKPYIIGITLDLLGWIFTLIAVQFLPLFLVESVIAFGIVITALIERFFRHQSVSNKSYFMILLILGGLVLLAISSSSQKSKPISHLTEYLILVVPIPIAALGYFIVKNKGRSSTILLAILSGLAFGGTSIVGRIFRFSHPLWHTIYSPIILSIIISGILGLMLFSASLQRAKATIVNAAMTVSQTIVPAIVGIIFFGDTARHGLWSLVIIGIILCLIGVSYLSIYQSN